MSLISYTLPCHQREADLRATLPQVIAAANAAPPVEIVLVDYGHPGTLVPLAWEHLRQCGEGVSLRTIRVEAQTFHMAHARNVGITAAAGDIVVAFLADQTVAPSFFADVRTTLAPHTFLKWQETFAFWKTDIVAAGGFDERFEFYGPEGKELDDRLRRRGLERWSFPDGTVAQMRTPNKQKVAHYRLPLTKTDMHERGMAIWRENMTQGLLVANEGRLWGTREVPTWHSHGLVAHSGSGGRSS